MVSQRAKKTAPGQCPGPQYLFYRQGSHLAFVKPDLLDDGAAARYFEIQVYPV